MYTRTSGREDSECVLEGDIVNEMNRRRALAGYFSINFNALGWISGASIIRLYIWIVKVRVGIAGIRLFISTKRKSIMGNLSSLTAP